MRAPSRTRTRASATGTQATPEAAPVRIAPRPPLARSARTAPLRVLAGYAPLAGALALAVWLALSLVTPARVAPGVSILVLTRDLPAGALVRAADLAPTRIAAPPAQLAALVPAAQEPSILGRALTAQLATGEPLPRAALAAGSDPAAITLSVGEEHALGGALVPGDRVSVLATFETASGEATTQLLARGLVVLAVGRPPSLGDPSQATVPVTLALGASSLAPRLALANSVAHIDLLRDGAATPGPMRAASAPAVAA